MSMPNRPEIRNALLITCIVPVLFVFHFIQEYFPFLKPGDVLGFLLIHLFGSILLLALCFLLLRDWSKAAFLNLVMLAIYFFFGSFHDFIKDVLHDNFFTRYRFLLPVIPLLILFAYWLASRSLLPVKRIVTFAFTVFVIFILIDAGIVIYKSLYPLSSGKIKLVERVEPEFKRESVKPDVYLLVFDEYAGSKVLENEFAFDNTPFEDSLSKLGFNVVRNPRSNYRWTLLSMSSMLNMSYLDLPGNRKLEYEDFLSAENLIRHNQVVEIFRNRGYEFINFSPFEIAGHKQAVTYPFQEEKLKVMSLHTLSGRIRKDLGWHIFKSTVDTTHVAESLQFELKALLKLLAAVKNEAKLSRETHRLVYGHFLLPHYPFLFDSSGRLRTVTEILGDTSIDAHKAAYLEYLKYGNNRILDLVKSVIRDTKGNSIVIAMSDHGYRTELKGINDTSGYLNLNAVYLPDKFKNPFYPGMTNVNQFRLLFKTIFGSELPASRDSICIIEEN